MPQSGVVHVEPEASQPVSKEKQTEETASKNQELNSNVAIGQFVLVNGAHLRFRDKRVEPPVIVDLDIEKAEVKNIDTSKPTEQAHASMVAKINEFTHFVLNGQATAVGPQMDLTLSSKLDDLDLPVFSSYAAEFGGVYLDQDGGPRPHDAQGPLGDGAHAAPHSGVRGRRSTRAGRR